MKIMNRIISLSAAVLLAAAVTVQSAVPVSALDYDEYDVWEEVFEEFIEFDTPAADDADEDIPAEEEVLDDYDWDDLWDSWGTGSTKKKYTKFTFIEADSSSIKVNVGNNSKAAKYKIYVYDKKKDKYVLKESITTESNEYRWFGGNVTLSELGSGTTYKLKQVTYDKNGKKINTEYLSARTLSKEPHVVVKNNGKKAVITWEPCQPKASGYEVYRKKAEDSSWRYYAPSTAEKLEDNGYKLSVRKSTASKGKITVKDGKDYVYVVRTFKVVGGERLYSAFSQPVSTESPEAYVNALKLTSHEYSSGEELKLVKKYVAQVTDSKMSNAEKLKAIFDLVSSHGKYQNDINKISASRPVWQLMVKGEGQCATWAYTLHSMLEYAGFDVRVVRGLRSSGQQHFWCQIKLDGKWYDLDAHLGAYLTPYDTDYMGYVIQDYSG